MKVRRWEFKDNMQISRLEEKYFPDPWNYRMLSESFLNGNFVGFVLEEGEIVKGYIGATYCLDEGEIALVAVDRDERRKGYATLLLKTLEDFLKAKGVTRLLLEVRRSNFAAQKCYVKYGFSVITIREKYYQNTEDALIMEKKL